MIAIFTIEDNNITITKGDSAVFLLHLVNGDETVFVPSEGDKIFFSVRQRKDKAHPLLLKKEGIEIRLESNETEKIPSGEYFYDVYIERSTGERQTAIEGKFKVRKAVHNFE